MPERSETSGATVAAADLYAVEIPMFRDFRAAFGTFTRDRLIVRLRTADGLEGWGDSGHLLAGYSGDTSASAFALAQTLAEAVLGADPVQLGVTHERMAARLQRAEQVKCAFDLALHDLAGKILGVPVSTLLGGAHVTHVETQMTVSLGAADQVIEDVRRALGFGVRSVCLKVGGSLRDDIENVSRVRAEFGDALDLWVDGNGGYTRGEAVRAIRAMAPLGVSLVEQPLPAWDIAGMAWVAAHVDTSLMADESVWSARDVYRIAAAEAADVIHMKLPKAGGLHGCRAVAAACEALGLPLVMATLAMTELGQAALLHFVAAHRVCHRYPTKVRAGGLFFPNDISDRMLDLENGVFRVPTDPGLGVGIDSERLADVTVASKEIAA